MGKLKINYDAEKDLITIGDLVINNDIVSQLEYLQTVARNQNKCVTKAVITMAIESPNEDPLFKDELDRENFFLNMKHLLDLTDALDELNPKRVRE